MAQIEAAELLEVLELVPFEDCVDDQVAQSLRERIATSIKALRGRAGLPPHDPLRLGKDGTLLSAKQLDKRLDFIIQSWPKEKHGTYYKKRL